MQFFDDYFKFMHVSNINLMIPGCNLACAYCSLAKTRKAIDQPNILQETFDAITNGEYLETWRKAFQKVKSDPKEMKTFEIWGQEPTLCLKYLTPVWKDWYEYFSGIETVGFSTNGIANTKELAEFFKEIDKHAYRPISCKIQFSWDGNFGQSQVRGAESDDIVIKNLLKLIKMINNYSFKYVKVYFNLHSVFSKDLISHLDTFEKVDQYFSHYSAQLDMLNEAIKNPKVQFLPGDLMASNCENFTTDDGIKCLEFIKRVNLLRLQKKYSVFCGWDYEGNLATMMFGQMARDMIGMVADSPYSNLDDYIEAFAKNPYTFRDGTMCPAFLGVLRMDKNGYMYDCHASCYDNYLEKDKLDDSIMLNAKYQAAAKGRYFNILTATEEEINEKIQFYRHTQHPSVFRWMYSQILSLMYMLALDGQIDKCYLKDFNKLKRHAFIISRFNMCYDGLKNRNGSFFLRGTEEVRQLCTGVVEEIEKYINEVLEDENLHRGRKDCCCHDE